MVNQTEIEMLPWVHNISCVPHRELIEYVRNLPKGARVAAEMSPAKIIYFGKLVDLIAGKKIDGRGITQEDLANLRGIEADLKLDRDAAIASLHPDLMAPVELFHICQQKGIQLFPLETFVSEEHGSRLLRAGELGYLALDTSLDNAFFRQVKTAMSRFKKGKLVVIVGAGHLGYIRKKLKAHGFKVSVKTDIFSKRATLSSIIGLNAKLRELGDRLRSDESVSEDELRKAFDRVRKINEAMASLERSNRVGHTRDLAKSIVEHAGRQQDRLQRRRRARRI